MSIIKTNEAYKKYHIKIFGLLGDIIFQIKKADDSLNHTFNINLSEPYKMRISKITYGMLNSLWVKIRIKMKQ